MLPSGAESGPASLTCPRLRSTSTLSFLPRPVTVPLSTAFHFFSLFSTNSLCCTLSPALSPTCAWLRAPCKRPHQGLCCSLPLDSCDPREQVQLGLLSGATKASWTSLGLRGMVSTIPSDFHSTILKLTRTYSLWFQPLSLGPQALCLESRGPGLAFLARCSLLMSARGPCGKAEGQGSHPTKVLCLPLGKFSFSLIRGIHLPIMS